MNILFPRIPLRKLPSIIAFAVLGAIIAGVYGILHDQITYSISPEYFTRFKFLQFYYTNFGWPVRWHVATIGFLATWWVGLIAGWFLGRLAVEKLPQKEVLKAVLTGFAIIFASAILFGICGWLFGVFSTQGNNIHSWDGWKNSAELLNIRSFAIVGCIHNGSYLGGLAGLILALIYISKKARTDVQQQP